MSTTKTLDDMMMRRQNGRMDEKAFDQALGDICRRAINGGTHPLVIQGMLSQQIWDIARFVHANAAAAKQQAEKIHNDLNPSGGG